jgi:phosphoglucomutase
MEYILSQKKSVGSLPANGFVVKTIVTSELPRRIAANYNVELIEVLTGFKFIGEKIKELDETGLKKYLFGFEESYGYLAGTFARDKDAVVAAMLIGRWPHTTGTGNVAVRRTPGSFQKIWLFYRGDNIIHA